MEQIFCNDKMLGVKKYVKQKAGTTRLCNPPWKLQNNFSFYTFFDNLQQSISL